MDIWQNWTQSFTRTNLLRWKKWTYKQLHLYLCNRDRAFNKPVLHTLWFRFSRGNTTKESIIWLMHTTLPYHSISISTLGFFCQGYIGNIRLSIYTKTFIERSCGLKYNLLLYITIMYIKYQKNIHIIINDFEYYYNEHIIWEFSYKCPLEVLFLNIIRSE